MLDIPERKEGCTMKNQELRDRVEQELDFDPGIDTSGIGIAVNRGVVTLTGHVPSVWQKMSAERAAWRVKGVKAIAEELEVRLPQDKKLSDDAIAERAVNILAWSSSVPKDAVRVKVQDGWITLTGEVEWHFQRSAAEREIRRLSGVTGVVNSIELKPRVQPADVKQRIVDALKRHAEVEASKIKIDIENGTVSISGEVDDWNERRAVELAVWSAPGVRMVEDHVRIR
jgi:osmotically-inducible protein OsmY